MSNNLPELVLRPIRKEDNVAVAQLIRTVMTQFGAVGEGFSIMDKEVDQMFEAYNHPKSAFWVITSSGEIVGCGGIGPLKGATDNTCELKKMYFYESARGQGMGKKMVSKCLKTAKSLGYEKCYLETLKHMYAANMLYQKMGFEEKCNASGNTGHGGCDTYYVMTL